jgi:phospholipid transport system substrate-binding protein
MGAIGRFVLARYWRRATTDQQTEFISLMEDYFVQLYAARFKAFAGFRMSIQKAQAQSETTIVETLIERPQGPPVQLDWRVDCSVEACKITDMVVQGISMVITQRSEFASVIRQSGGKIEGLLRLLRKKTNR